ncbi:TonB-dependent copper receptor, partial [Pseudomonas aeruginosa]
LRVLLGQEHSQQPDNAVELAPSKVTSVAQSSPMTIVTNPKEPRQPVTTSDGADYPTTIPGIAVIRSGGSNGEPLLRERYSSRP